MHCACRAHRIISSSPSLPGKRNSRWLKFRKSRFAEPQSSGRLLGTERKLREAKQPLLQRHTQVSLMRMVQTAMRNQLIRSTTRRWPLPSLRSDIEIP